MGADGGVDPAGAVQFALADDFLIQRLAHAVQALELVLAGVVVAARHGVDGGQRIGVVGRELREDGVGCGQQFAGTGDVGDVGVDLAGEDGEVFQAFDLGALDLAVPIGALDQPDHQPVAAAAAQIDDVVEREGGALLVGLHDEADAVPSRQIGVEAKLLQQVEREFQPVGFLGIDVEADIVGAGEDGEGFQARQKLGHRALLLGARVAGVEGRELDRDAGAFVDPAPVGRPADGVDRLFVFAVVAVGVGGGDGGFAQHVVGIAEAFGFHPAAVRQRFRDGLAGDELLAHHPHGDIDALADHRLSAARDQAGEGGGQVRLAGGRGQAAGDDKAPGGGVDEQGRAVAEVGVPVADADLVADQRVAGGAVGDAQQRFRQTHQRDTFLAGQGVFVDQALDAAGAGLAAQRLGQFAGEIGG